VCTPDCFVFDNGPSCEVEACPEGLECSSIFVCLPGCANNADCPAGSYCSGAGICEPDLYACMVCSLVAQLGHPPQTHHSTRTLEGVELASELRPCRLVLVRRCGQLLKAFDAICEALKNLADLVTEVHDTHHPLGVSLYYEDQKEAARRRSQLFVEQRLPRFLGYFQRVLEHCSQFLRFLLADELHLGEQIRLVQELDRHTYLANLVRAENRVQHAHTTGVKLAEDAFFLDDVRRQVFPELVRLCGYLELIGGDKMRHAVVDATGAHPFSKLFHERLVVGERLAPEPAVLYAQPFERRRVVQQRDQARPRPVEVRYEQDRALVRLQRRRDMVGVRPAAQYDNQRRFRIDLGKQRGTFALFC